VSRVPLQDYLAWVFERRGTDSDLHPLAANDRRCRSK
jgi:hypothetical protein